MRLCPNCNAAVTGRSNRKYCSKKCQNYFLKKRWVENNIEHVRERQRARRADPEKWAAEKARARERLKTDKWRAYWRAHNKQFRSKTLHGRVIGLNAHVRSRKQSTLYVDKRDVLNKFGELETWFCYYCNTVEDLTFDHIKPFCNGGEHTIENLQILCRSCNSTKGCNERWKTNSYAI